MIKELKIDLRQVENVLLYRVIQQDESFTGKGEIFDNGDVSIYSLLCKLIIDGDLYIDGTDKCGRERFTAKIYDTLDEATSIKEGIEKCVADFNEYIRKENEKEKYGFSCGEEYWFVTDHGVVHNSKWKNRHSDKFRCNSKNAFKTKEEAGRKLKILNYIYENQTIFTKEQWEDEDLPKLSVYTIGESHTLKISYSYFCKDNTYFFDNKETARKVADFIGYDDFVKYL